MPKKILIIDDERGVVMILTKILQNKGYEVDSATTVREAAQKLLQYKPDLIITDDVMPGIKGSELVKILKGSDDTVHIPIIMVSGKGEMVYSDKQERFKWQPNNPNAQNRGDIPDAKKPDALAAAYNVDDYIAKPFKSEMVEQIVEEVLSGKRKKKNDDED